ADAPPARPPEPRGRHTDPMEVARRGHLRVLRSPDP
ncbi:hypothetical protein N566_09680, partial [Streptomycetaceae bacterium MP113-05]